MTAIQPVPRARFARESALHDLRCPRCPSKQHINQRGVTIEASILVCKRCGQWLYVVAPRTMQGMWASTRIIAYAVTPDETALIERHRLNPLEVLLYLGVVDLHGVTLVHAAVSS